MEKNRLIIIISVVFVFLISIFGGIFYFMNHRSVVKEFDVAMIEREALEYNDLFDIKCDTKNVMASDDVVCTVMLNSMLQNYPFADDILEYVSFDYDLGNFLTLSDVSVKSPNREKIYDQFVLDKSVDGKIILKNMNDLSCSSSNDCRSVDRTFYSNVDNRRRVYVDSISDILFQFKFKVSEKATYSDVVSVNFPHVYFYS